MLETTRSWILTLSLAVLAGAAVVAVAGVDPAIAGDDKKAADWPECHVIKPMKDVAEALEEAMGDHMVSGRYNGMFLTGAGSAVDPRVLCAW